MYHTEGTGARKEFIMATIEKRQGKTGTSYRITVACGLAANREQVRHRMTWKPEPGMTARQEQKALQRAVADFERSIEQGYQIDIYVPLPPSPNPP